MKSVSMTVYTTDGREFTSIKGTEDEVMPEALATTPTAAQLRMIGVDRTPETLEDFVELTSLVIQKALQDPDTGNLNILTARGKMILNPHHVTAVQFHIEDDGLTAIDSGTAAIEGVRDDG